MTDADSPAVDPSTAPFWTGARSGVLLVQRCTNCEYFQLYPREICVACESRSLEWVKAQQRGIVFSKTTVHVDVVPHLVPPYDVILVELEEGPSLFALCDDQTAAIGDSVDLVWRNEKSLPLLFATRRAPAIRQLAQDSTSP